MVATAFSIADHSIEVHSLIFPLGVGIPRFAHTAVSLWAPIEAPITLAKPVMMVPLTTKKTHETCSSGVKHKEKQRESISATRT